MSLLRIGVFVGLLGSRRRLIDLGLQPCFHHVERTCDRTRQPTSSGTCEKFKRHANVSAVLIPPRPSLELLPEHELECGERKVAVKSGAVSVEESRSTFGLDDGPGSIDRSAVVVT